MALCHVLLWDSPGGTEENHCYFRWDSCVPVEIRTDSLLVNVSCKYYSLGLYLIPNDGRLSTIVYSLSSCSELTLSYISLCRPLNSVYCVTETATFST